MSAEVPGEPFWISGLGDFPPWLLFSTHPRPSTSKLLIHNETVSFSTFVRSSSIPGGTMGLRISTERPQPSIKGLRTTSRHQETSAILPLSLGSNFKCNFTQLSSLVSLLHIHTLNKLVKKKKFNFTGLVCLCYSLWNEQNITHSAEILTTPALNSSPRLISKDDCRYPSGVSFIGPPATPLHTYICQQKNAQYRVLLF